MADVVVNAMGEQCPIPVVKAGKALAQMHEAGTLLVHVDNETAVQNVLRMASGKGLRAVSEVLEEGHWVVRICVDGTVTAEEPAPVCCESAPRGECVVAISSAAMGTGNDELGKTLMKGFLFALSQLDTPPDTVLFYNGGATIPIEGSAALEDLTRLQAQGVKIMTCGTCLDFYGLKDKLAVGSVTNMYQIVQTLRDAAKILRP